VKYVSLTHTTGMYIAGEIYGAVNNILLVQQWNTARQKIRHLEI